MEYNKNDVRVAILTPYLVIGKHEWQEKNDAEKQIALCGYDPNNIIRVHSLHTRRGRVVKLLTGKDGIGFRELLDARPHLVISGSTPYYEILTSELKQINPKWLRPLVARYSRFYGNISEYTGKWPAETGFALDIPKNAETVKWLIQDDTILEGIVDRNLPKIRSGLTGINTWLTQPVLETPYLTQTLS